MLLSSLINLGSLVSQVCQFHPLLLDVEEVGVGVQVVQPVRVQRGQLLEEVDSLVNLTHVVVGDGNLVKDSFDEYRTFFVDTEHVTTNGRVTILFLCFFLHAKEQLNCHSKWHIM